MELFEWKVEEKGELIWHIKEDKIAEEEQVDGCYVIKTTATQNNINKEEVVKNYQRLQNIEYAFKNMKTTVLVSCHVKSVANSELYPGLGNNRH